MTHPRPPRGFRLQAVFFDFDGTLTEPGAIDFAAMRRALQCPPGTLILEFIAAQPDPARRAELLATVRAIELEAAAASMPNLHAESVVRRLKAQGIPIAIITRNDRASIDRALENFDALSPEDFDLIVARDAPVFTKPAPDAVHWAADHLGVPVEGCLMVGDFLFDVQAGNAAGAVTVLMRNHRPPGELGNGTGDVAPAAVSASDAASVAASASATVAAPDAAAQPAPRVDPPPSDGPSLGTFEDWAADADYVIDDLSELAAVVRLGQPLPQGKFPNDLLETYLQGIAVPDPAVIISAGIGEDIAAVDVEGEEVLVLKADPITFATDAVGQYAVLVNANDIATSGATPRWLLATFLFPVGATPSEVLSALGELQEACARWGIGLCGGHTEITDAVSRAVVSGAMAGTVRRDGLIDKGAMRTGDRVLLTKALAVEGTALIAREFGGRLVELGMSPAEVESARGFLAHLSILEEARIASASGGVSAMHDVTEGGLATALRELAVAGRHGIVVDLDSIPVFPETRQVCALLGLDPLGLIGSGSLLICCRPEEAAALVDALGAAGVAVAEIGRVSGPGEPVEALRAGVRAHLPSFAADEVARLF